MKVSLDKSGSVLGVTGNIKAKTNSDLNWSLFFYYILGSFGSFGSLGSFGNSGNDPRGLVVLLLPFLKYSCPAFEPHLPFNNVRICSGKLSTLYNNLPFLSYTPPSLITFPPLNMFSSCLANPKNPAAAQADATGFPRLI